MRVVAKSAAYVAACFITSTIAAVAITMICIAKLLMCMYSLDLDYICIQLGGGNGKE